MSAEGGSFAADWLALREPADGRARNPDLVRRLAHEFAGRETVRVLDLGTGTGSNLRALAPHLPAGQAWVLADHDEALLALAADQAPEGIAAETRRVDLASDLETLFSPAPDLVTAAAFLDLCGEAWLDRLAGLVTGAGAVLYAVLSYDGRETWMPPHPDDDEVLEAFHADQRREKGLGPALGPEAHAWMAARMRAAGYRVIEGRSAWELEAPRDSALLAALAEGVAGAVGGVGGRWGVARRNADGAFIGHKDLLALPEG